MTIEARQYARDLLDTHGWEDAIARWLKVRGSFTSAFQEVVNLELLYADMGE